MKLDLLLIDLSGIFHANWHATADMGESEAFARTIAKVTSLRHGYRYCAVACDAPPYFRKEISPAYKAQRDKPPEAMLEQFRRVKERLDCDGFLLWECRGFEADDVIATAVEGAKRDGLDVMVASSDKDLLQLVSDADHVRVQSISTGKVYERADVIEKFGVAPEMLGDALAMMGDKSDNIPGMDSIGPVKAAKLLNEYGDLNGVLSNCDKLKGAIQQAVFSGAQNALLARKLVTLRTDVPLNFEDIYAERKPRPMADMGPDDDEGDGVPISPPPSAPDASGELMEAPSMANSTTALATVPVDWALQLEPTTLDLAWKLAGYFHNSRLYQRNFGTREAIFAVIVRGREMGISAATALDSLSFFEGKVNVGAHLLIARAKAHPDCEYFQYVGGDDTYAEWTTKNRHNPAPTTLRYTIQQAEAVGFLRDPNKNPNWAKRRPEMLRKTCGVQLARIEYPGALHDAYCPEEMGVPDA